MRNFSSGEMVFEFKNSVGTAQLTIVVNPTKERSKGQDFEKNDLLDEENMA